MTSNLGSEEIQQSFEENPSFTAAEQVAKEKVMQRLKMSVRPEFLNRIDDILLFSPLTQKEIEAIVQLQLTQLSERFAEQGLTLSASPDATRLLAEWGFDPLFGGRPVKRVITEKVLNPLSKKILEKELPNPTQITIEVDGEQELRFAFQGTKGVD